MPGVAQQLDRVVEHQVGVADELVELVEVPAGALHGLQRLAQLAQRLDGGRRNTPSGRRCCSSGPTSRPVPTWSTRLNVMADRIRWGILSTGSIASTFVEDLRLLPDAEVAAVGSRTDRARERFAAKHGIARAHGSWQALVDDPEVDAIYVATPHTAHFDATMLSLAAGKATLTEKPFTLDVGVLGVLVDTARTSGVFLMEAMWMRCIPAVRRMVDLVDERRDRRADRRARRLRHAGAPRRDAPAVDPGPRRRRPVSTSAYTR